MFTLHRPDVFPVDDFGVREGYRILHGMEAQPKPKPFAVLGQAYGAVPLYWLRCISGAQRLHGKPAVQTP